MADKSPILSTTTNGVYNFPSIARPDREKDVKYYEQFTRAIVANTFTNGWTTSYNILKSLYSFFLDGTGSDLTGYLQTAPDGSQMPGIWTSLNSLRSKIDLLVGEMEERGYVIKARALNSEAYDRKREEKERLRVRRHLQELLGEVELPGMPLETREYVPQSEEELNEYMDLTWKDKHVIILEAALKWIAQTTEWDEKRKALFRDVLIANRAIIKNEVIQGVPQARRIDPLRFIFDPNSTDDMLSDSTYFGEVDYMPLAQAAQEYGLSEKELNECYDTYQSYLGMGLDARGSSGDNLAFGCMPGQSLRWFKIEDGSPRCLVIRAAWRDYKTLANKYEKKEEYNTEYLQDVSDEPIRKRDEGKIIYNKIECWRQATIIGGKFCREYGECVNQARDLNKLQRSESPYKVWVPNFLLGRSVSKLEQLIGLQIQKDIAAYQVQIQMARAIGKVLVMDEAMLPEGMTRESAMSYIKADGIAWVNSKEYQLGAGTTNLFKDFDISLSESIGQALSVIQYYDQQINAISGVSEERQGIVQGSSQAVGVTNAALFQSNLVTAPYFKGFERFCSRVLNHQAKLVKLTWAAKEIYAPIIGTVGVDFLRDNIDISLDEFDVVIQSLPPLTLDRQKLEQMLMIAVQSDPAFLSDALAIMLEPDTAVAVRKFQRKYALRQIYQEQQAAQQAQQEQAMAEQQMAMQQQVAADNRDVQLQLQQMKGENATQKTLITGRTKLSEKKLDLLKQ
jgi:hypothetical protein